MNRTLLAAVLAAAVLAPTPAVAGPMPVARAETLTVVRQYGDGPVTVPADTDRARIRFNGRAGDRVDLAGSWCGAHLSTLDGRRVAERPSGFWRLPNRGAYEVRWRRCAAHHGRVRLQLQKLRVHRLTVDGGPVPVPERRGYLQAVAVQVPASGRVQVTPRQDGGVGVWERLVLPHGRAYTADDCWIDEACGDGSILYLEAGRPIGAYAGPYGAGPDGGPVVTQAGDRVLVVTDESLTFVAKTDLLRPTTVDGAPVDVSEAAAYQEVALELDGAAGQWIRLEPVAGDATLYPDLVGADGTQEPGSWRGTLAFWQLPTTGRYRIVLGGDRVAEDAVVRVRSVRPVATPLRTDGTPVEYPVTTRGEWLVAPVEGTGGVSLNGTATAGADGWFGYAESLPRYRCSYYGPLGCGDFQSMYVDEGFQGPRYLFDQMFLDEGGGVVVVGMAPAATGVVTLRFTPPPS